MMLATSGHSDLALWLIALEAWPLLCFTLSRYHFRLSLGRSIAWAVAGVAITLYLGIALGDGMASAQHQGQRRTLAVLVVVQDVVFAGPYVILALWLALRSIRRFSGGRSRPNV